MCVCACVCLCVPVCACVCVWRILPQLVGKRGGGDSERNVTARECWGHARLKSEAHCRTVALQAWDILEENAWPGKTKTHARAPDDAASPHGGASPQSEHEMPGSDKVGKHAAKAADKPASAPSAAGAGEASTPGRAPGRGDGKAAKAAAGGSGGSGDGSWGDEARLVLKALRKNKGRIRPFEDPVDLLEAPGYLDVVGF